MNKFSELIKAIKCNKLEEVKKLIRIRIQKSEVVMVCYEMWGYPETLINKEIINKKDSNGETPLIIACRGHKEICFLLIKMGANVNIKNNHGETALMVACLCKCEEICLMLIKGKADINEKDQNEHTTLLLTYRNANKEIFLLLISSGCDYSCIFKKISYKKKELKSLRIFMMEYIKNQKEIKLSKLINIVPEEILDDINNKCISYCSKCYNYFYFYRFEITIQNIFSENILKVNVHCL